MSRHVNLNPIVLSAAFVIGAGSLMSHAAGGRPEGGAVANVDLQRVFDSSDAHKAASGRIRDYSDTLTKRFNEISQQAFLSPDEIFKLSAAMNQDKPTDADTKTVKDLEAASAQRGAEYQALQQKQANLTDKDKDRIRELSGIQQQRGATLDRLEQLYQRALSDFEARELRAATLQVRSLVGKLAKEQGCSQVWDATALLYAPLDLTDQAVKRAQSAPAKP